jgi:hypothetical protein
LQTKAIDSAVKGAKEALEKELNKANEDVKELALKQLEQKGLRLLKTILKLNLRLTKRLSKHFCRSKR